MKGIILIPIDNLIGAEAQPEQRRYGSSFTVLSLALSMIQLFAPTAAAQTMTLRSERGAAG